MPARSRLFAVLLAAAASAALAGVPTAATAQDWDVAAAARSASRPRFATRIAPGSALRGGVAVRVGGLAPQHPGALVAVRVFAARPGGADRTPVANTVLTGLPGTFSWDTAQVANGWYEMEVAVIDAGSEREAVTDRMRFEVNNGFDSRVRPAAPPRPTPAPAPEPEFAPAPAADAQEESLPRFSRDFAGVTTPTPPAPRSSGRSAGVPSFAPSPRPAWSPAAAKGVVAEALKHLGAPYRFGASGRDGAFDCSSFTQTIFRRFGVSLPRTAASQFGAGTQVPRSVLKPGDLVFFQGTYKEGISHVGIYLGDGHFVHAANRKQGVRVDRIDGSYYAAHWAGARRVR